MDSLIARIIQEIMRPYHRLSIITNPDGFLRLGKKSTLLLFSKN